MRTLFSAVLSDSFDLDKPTFRGVSEVKDFESFTKIELGPFLAAPVLSPSFA